MTDAADTRRATPLLARIQEAIRRDGPMPLSRYMELSATHYYGRGDVFGRSGDFVTAPEISQIFGELLGLWCAVVWQWMGRPDPVRLIELGPGRGTLMRDALRAARLVPDFLAAVRVHLVESSAALEALQRDTLAGVAAPLTWHEHFRQVPPGPAITLANEFLDALPVDQFIKTQDGWARRSIVLDDDGKLQFAAVAQPWLGPTGELMARSAGDVVPVAEYGALPQWLASRCGPGTNAPQAALFIDYGHLRSAPGDTLQAVRDHAFEHPLCSPGEADLTVQVDFEDFERQVAKASQANQEIGQHTLALDGPVTQAEFLSSLGIAERASRLMAANPAEANAIEMAVGRLMSPSGMGTRFKVLGVRNAQLPPLPGFPALDRRPATP